MKQITITIPDNCELKQDGNTYTIVEKEKKLTYADVADEIFSNGKYHYFIGACSDIIEIGNFPLNYKLPNNCTSEKQAEKLLAINKLMNVAKYLNGNWQPNWNNTSDNKYYIKIEYGKIGIDYALRTNHIDIYFKSRELAEKAIEILGEEMVRIALCTDY